MTEPSSPLGRDEAYLAAVRLKPRPNSTWATFTTAARGEPRDKRRGWPVTEDSHSDLTVASVTGVLSTVDPEPCLQPFTGRSTLPGTAASAA
jgi:hypothetical protein